MNELVKYSVNDETIELKPETVKNYLVSGNGNVSDQEVQMFMNLCQYQKLNPLIKEAYLIKFGSQPAQIIVSKEAFMKRAEAHENFKGFDAGIIYEFNDEIHEAKGAVKPKKAELLGGWCKVYRSDRENPIEVQVSLEEFGKSQATWKDMPMNMIRKVAIVNAMREAFPNVLGAMYTEEEKLDQKPSDVPGYKRERTDITPDQEPQSETTNNDPPVDPAEALRQQLKDKLPKINVRTDEEITKFIAQHVPKAKKPLSQTDLAALVSIVDELIVAKESIENEDLPG